MFSAYTIRKILPRLLIAVIMIQLSWWIVIQAININNDIAHGLEALVYAPFGGVDAFSINNFIEAGGNSVGAFTGIFSAAAAGTLVGFALGPGTALGVLALAGTAILGILIAVFTLVLRQAVLIFLVVIAPLAIVAWVLPGTEKFWKLWWESFTKLLLMYPLILLMIAAGRIFAYVAASMGANQLLTFAMIVLGMFGPLFMIPATLKLAGAAFTTLTSAVNSRNKGVFDRLRNVRAEQTKDNRERMAAGTKFRGGNDSNRRGRWNRGFQAAVLAPKVGGLDVTKWGSRIDAARTTGSMIGREKMLQDDDYSAWKNNDDLNRFASQSNNAEDLRKKLLASGNYKLDSVVSMQNMNRDIANVERMRRKYGDSSFKQATWIQAMAGGTTFDKNKDGVYTPNAWAAAATVAGNDDAILADLVGKGRSAAMGAGRVDQGGAGWNETFQIAKKFQKNPNYDQATARNELADRVYDGQGAGVLVHSSMKPVAVENVLPAMKRSIEKAVGDGDARQTAQGFASLAAVYENMNATSPQKARILADGLMSETVPTAGFSKDVKASLAVADPNNAGDMMLPSNVTYSQAIEAMRGDPQFQQMRKEFQSEYASQSARQLQGGAPGTPGGVPTTPIGPPTGAS